MIYAAELQKTDENNSKTMKKSKQKHVPPLLNSSTASEIDTNNHWRSIAHTT